ncbi:MAG: DUF6517 family protein [Salinigranum sp.]
MKPRRSLAVFALLIVLVSGCLGAATGDSLSFSSSPARASEAAVAHTGFEKMRSASPTFEHDFDVGGKSYHVRLDSHVTYYRADYRGATLAYAAILSTPKAAVMGQGLNPAGHLGGTDLVERALSAVSDVQAAKKVGTREVRILGEQVTVTKYRATDGNGNSNAYVLFARIEHDGDYVVAAASYPAEMDGAERDAITLFRSIRH